MITRTLAALRSRVRARADMESTSFVSDSEVNHAINYAARSFFAVLIQAYGEGHFETSATFNTVAGQYDYSSALPSSFYRLLGMSTIVSGNSQHEVIFQRGTTEDMRRYTLTDEGWDDAARIYYQLRGQTIRLAPVPSGVHTVTIRYVSANLFFDTGGTAIVELSTDTDEVRLEDLLWEDFIITAAAIRCKEKEDSDTTLLRQSLADTVSLVTSSASQRDLGEPSRIRMVM